MPVKMISDMPLPTPRSLICSPSHMMNIDSAVMEKTVSRTNPSPGFTGEQIKETEDGALALAEEILPALHVNAWRGRLAAQPVDGQQREGNSLVYEVTVRFQTSKGPSVSYGTGVSL